MWRARRVSQLEVCPRAPNVLGVSCTAKTPRAEAEAARRLPPRSCKATTGELQPP
jgi:hypothetical protein